WRIFWNTALSSSVRNLWFRSLHRKIPCRVRLHAVCPNLLTSDLCRKKKYIWLSVWQDLLLQPFNGHKARLAIFPCQYLPDPPIIASATVTESILHCIWQVHWAFVFDDKSFIPNHVINSIHNLMARRMAEKQVPSLSL
ncbi:hypothetical protein BJV82DRAFT_525786, partial [Fennellomyces sp. T-0311]